MKKLTSKKSLQMDKIIKSFVSQYKEYKFLSNVFGYLNDEYTSTTINVLHYYPSLNPSKTEKCKIIQFLKKNSMPFKMF